MSSVAASTTFTGDDLYDIVAAYAGFGNHHTGTEADARTTQWLTELLVGLGAEVHEEPFDFDRYVCDIELRAGGRAVPGVPVFYGPVGRWNTDGLGVVDVDVAVAGNPRGLDPYLDAEPGCAALVVAIDGPDDLPVWCNRVPTAGGDRPAVVIPRNWAARVRDGAELSFAASLEAGRSANVIATLGAPDGRPLNVTTPLTGWTPAGSERGTGLAVALAMAAELAADHRVTFSACSGHEIDHLGLRHHLGHHSVVDEPVVHLGASVAAIERGVGGSAELGGRRLVLTTATGGVRSEIDRIVPAANWRLRDLDPWPGEGGTWREAGAAVLSFLGGSSLFHTLADTAEATTPQALALAAEVAIEAARLFLGSDR